MKKITSLLPALILVVCLTISPLIAHATEPALLSITGAESARGGTFTLTLSLHQNPGLCALGLEIRFDENVLELLDVEVQNRIGTALPRENLASPYPLTWIDYESKTNNTETGTLCTLTFRVLENAPALGSTTVSVVPISAYDTNYQPVAVTGTDTQIPYADALRGDFDGNGILNSNDARHLLCHIVFKKEDYPINQKGDLNRDGTLNSDDALYLLYHVMFGQELFPL